MMKPRVLVALVVIAAACGAHNGTTTSTNSGSGAALTTGSAGGSVFATGSASSCGLIGSGNGEGGAAAACNGAPTGVSYSKDIAPIFGGCMGDVCHHPVWTFENTVGKSTPDCCDGRLLIDPGDPSRSYIVNKLQGNVCNGRQMPLDPDTITPDQIELIVGWVCEGAPNN
jgi:hypothetical protein